MVYDHSFLRGSAAFVAVVAIGGARNTTVLLSEAYLRLVTCVMPKRVVCLGNFATNVSLVTVVILVIGETLVILEDESVASKVTNVSLVTVVILVIGQTLVILEGESVASKVMNVSLVTVVILVICQILVILVTHWTMVIRVKPARAVIRVKAVIHGYSVSVVKLKTNV